MRFASIAAVGAVMVMVSSAAHATIYFDSVDVANPTSNADGIGDGVAAMADSFTAGTPDFNTVSLLLSTSGDPSPTGSAMVYLVPDDASGGSLGLGGMPTISTDNNGNFLSFSGATLIGSVSDSAISGSGTLVSFNIPAGAASATANAFQEYWIGVVLSGTSTIQWDYGSSSDGIGETNQASFFAFTTDGGGGYGTIGDTTGLDNSPAYDLIVSTPEPTTIALLGAGLAGIGFSRRKVSRKA
jgi:hypothetical protein